MQALEAGASGYVSKQADRPTVSPATAAILPVHLTAREATIAELLSRGLTNPMTAERLCLSTKTVANYVSTGILKLRAAGSDEAARIGAERPAPHLKLMRLRLAGCSRLPGSARTHCPAAWG